MVAGLEKQLYNPVSRREFLKGLVTVGAGVSGVLGTAGCLDKVGSSS